MKGESLWGSGGEVGVLHGVEAVNGVSHPSRQETAVPCCQEAVSKVTKASIAVQVMEHCL